MCKDELNIRDATLEELMEIRRSPDVPANIKDFAKQRMFTLIYSARPEDLRELWQLDQPGED